jgi:hypothetical protein
VFIKVDSTSFTEMFAANDWKPFQSCFLNTRPLRDWNVRRLLSTKSNRTIYCCSLFDSDLKRASAQFFRTKLLSRLAIGGSGVSNPVYTDTGIPVFGTPNTDTGKNLPVFAGIENV